MTLGVGVDHVIDAACPYQAAGTLNDDTGEVTVTADAKAGIPILVTKYATYQSSRSVPAPELVGPVPPDAGPGDPGRIRQPRHQPARESRPVLGPRRRPGKDPAQPGAAPAGDPVEPLPGGAGVLAGRGAGIPAKGLTGQAYEGHYFWDTEIYVLPFLSYTQPRIAGNVLRFRHSMLDRARERARELSQRGALFPWRTINGEEASSNFQQGTAQYHINADIAYAIKQYASVLGDSRLLGGMGAEVLVETARLWEDLGFYGADEQFHIHGVTGPGRVHHRGQRQLLHQPDGTAEPEFRGQPSLRRMRADLPGDYAALVRRVALQPGEVESWERAAAAMYVPFDLVRGIHPQSDAFLEPGGLGPRQHAAGEVPAAAALSPAGDLPAPGAQAGRHRAGDVPARQRVLGGAEAPQLRLLRPDHHRGFVLVGVRAEHHRRRGRQRAPGARVLRVRAADGPGRRRGQRF